MRLREIAFRGYKPFPGGESENGPLQRLKLAPLTLVFGKNNSGKSAVVRLPRLLLGGLACKDERILPLKVGEIEYGGQFLDLVHGRDFFRRPTFEVHAELDREHLDLSVTLFSPGALTADEPPRLWSYDMAAPSTVQASPPDSRTKDLELHGLLPARKSWDRWRDAAAELLQNMVHIGPMRSRISGPFSLEQPQLLELDGASAPQLLRVDPALADAVGSWFEENLEGCRLSVSLSNEAFSLWVRRSATMASNLAQAGEGLQQVLPVVVHQLWRQRSASGPFLDVVEQPELHLHDAAQAPLADLFIDTALQGHGQVIVETHSEPLLLRVQRRVAEGRIVPDQVQIYFVDVTPQGSQLRRVLLAPNGEVDWWPTGVFEEDFQEVAALRRAQRLQGEVGAPA